MLCGNLRIAPRSRKRSALCDHSGGCARGVWRDRQVISDVRFTPERGHSRCTSACPLCTNSGHRRIDPHKQKIRLGDGLSKAQSPIRPAGSPNVKSQSANKQCHHVDCWHKTIPVSESAPKYPTRNGDDGRPTVFPNPVHAFSPTLGIGQLLYTDNQSAMREMSALTPKADIAPTRSPAPLLLLRLEREKPE